MTPKYCKVVLAHPKLTPRHFQVVVNYIQLFLKQNYLGVQFYS